MKEQPEESIARPSSSHVRQFKGFLVTEEVNKRETGISPAVRKREDWVIPPLFNGKQRQVNGLSRPQASLQQEQETPPLPSYSVPITRRNAPFSRLQLESEKLASPRLVQEKLVSDDADKFDILDTIPMMVLRDIAKRQGQSSPEMQSEVTGAAGNAAVIGLGNIAGYVINYGYNFLLQRGLGAKNFGLFSISLSLVTLIASIFDLGLDNAMIRYIGIYRGKKQTSLVRTLTIFCTAIAGITGMLGALLVLFAAPWLANLQHKPAIASVLQLMAPLIPLMCLQTIWTGGLQGLKEFKRRVLVQRFIIPVPLFLLLAVVFFYFHDVTSATLVMFISTLVGAIANLYFLFRAISRTIKPGPESYEVRSWLGFAAPNFLTTITNTVLDSVDTLLLAFFVPALAIGQYTAAIKITGFILMPLNSLNVMFTPTIAELHGRGEKQKLETMFKVVTNWSITLCLPTFLIAILFSVPLLGLPGKEYIGGWPLLVALAAGNLISALVGPVGYLLLMTGHQKYSFFNSLSVVILTVVIGLALAPHIGAMGVAISTGLAVGVINCIKVIEVFFLLKIHPYRRDTLKPIGAGVISAMVTGGLLYLFKVAHFSLQIFHLYLTVELQLVLIPVFLACYIALIALFKLSPEDQIVVDKLTKRFKFGGKRKKQGRDSLFY
jgi:O-antigen/teichoic acid export membrane protein